MGYEVFMKERELEVQDTELEKDTTPKFRKFLNRSCLIIGIALIITYIVGPMFVTTTQFARASFDYYDTNTYVYNMFEDETNYVFTIKVDEVTHFDIYNKSSGEMTHDVNSSFVGEVFDEDTDLIKHMNNNGYANVSSFFIQSAWSIAIISGIALILFSIANQHLSVRSRIAQNKGQQIAREINKVHVKPIGSRAGDRRGF